MAKSITVEDLPDGGHRIVADLKPFDKIGMPHDKLEFALEISSVGSLRVRSTVGLREWLLPMTFVSTRFRPGPNRRPNPKYAANPLHETMSVLAGMDTDAYSLERLLKEHNKGTLANDISSRLRAEEAGRAKAFVEAAVAANDTAVAPKTRRRNAETAWLKKERQRHGMKGRVFARYYNAIWRRTVPFLDAEALRIARSVVGMNTMELYELLVARPDLKDMCRVFRPAARLLRVKAAPEFAPGMKLREMIGKVVAESATGADIRDVVRATGSWTPSPGFMKWGKTARTGPSMCFGHGLPEIVENLAMLGDQLDPNGIAKLSGRKQWYCFHAVAARLPQLVPNFLRDPERSTESIYEYYPEGHAARTGPRISQITTVLTEVRDALDLTGVRGAMTLRHVFRAAAAEQAGEPERVLTQGIPAMLERARQHHRDAVAQAQLRRNAARGGREDVAFPEPKFSGWADDKFQLVWLSTPRMLADEGAAMEHCVGGYDDTCRVGRSLIYGLRSPSGERVATLEVGANYSQMQLKSARNGEPGREAKAWVAKVLKAARKTHVAESTATSESTEDFDDPFDVQLEEAA